MALADLQRLLVEALPQRDPAAALNNASASSILSSTEMDTLRHLSDEGLLLTSLVLVKLRIQQLLKNPLAAKMFEDDPNAFARCFEQYHSDCPMSDFLPEDESRRFTDWLRNRGKTRL